jgi:preprotein translocase subunit SecG
MGQLMRKIGAGLKEFFGIGGFERKPEGFMSWQHILLVTLFMAGMIILAIIIAAFSAVQFRLAKTDNG